MLSQDLIELKELYGGELPSVVEVGDDEKEILDVYYIDSNKNLYCASCAKQFENSNSINLLTTMVGNTKTCCNCKESYIVSINNYIDNLNCTEYYEHSDNLRDMLEDSVSEFVENNNLELEDFETSLYIIDNKNLYRSLKDILDNAYIDFIDNLEDDDEGEI